MSEPLARRIDAKIRPRIVRERLRASFSNSKTKINDESVVIVNEALRLLVVEAALRAAKRAPPPVEADHVAKILCQLETIRIGLMAAFENANTRIRPDAVEPVAGILNAFVIEIALRALRRASTDHRTVVEIEQIENVVPPLFIED